MRVEVAKDRSMQQWPGSDVKGVHRQFVSVAYVAGFADVAPSIASRLVDRAVTAGFVQRTRLS